MRELEQTKKKFAQFSGFCFWGSLLSTESGRGALGENILVFLTRKLLAELEKHGARAQRPAPSVKSARSSARCKSAVPGHTRVASVLCAGREWTCTLAAAGFKLLHVRL